MVPLKTLIKNGGIFLGLCAGTFLGIVLILNLAGMLFRIAIFLLWEHPVSIIIILFIFGAWYITKYKQENDPPQLREEDKFDIFN